MPLPVQWNKKAKAGLNAEKIWAYVAGAALLFSAASAFV